MDGMMDVLAEASAAAAAQEASAAAEVLGLLRTHRESPTPEEEGEGEFDGAEDAPRPWTAGEDDLLRRLAAARQAGAAGRGRGPPAAKPAAGTLDVRAWREIAGHFDERTPLQCAHRFQKVVHPENIKGPWCPSEDSQLVELVAQYGGKHWARIASMLPGRTGKQCRERWCNNLDPSLKKGAWTGDEDQVILRMHAKLGTRWAEIAKCLPGRSDNSVKNRWYSTCSRILRQQQEEAEGSSRDGSSRDGAAAPAADAPPVAPRLESERGAAPPQSPATAARTPSPSEEEGSPLLDGLDAADAAAPRSASRRVEKPSLSTPRERKRKAPATLNSLTSPQKLTAREARDGHADGYAAAAELSAARAAPADGVAGADGQAAGAGMKVPSTWPQLSVDLPTLDEPTAQSALSAEAH